MSPQDRSRQETPAGASAPSAPSANTPDIPTEPTTRIPLKIEDVLTVLIMVLLALITFGNVVVRYFTSASFAWTEEISVFLMVMLTMVAGSAAFARHRHVRIELLADRGSAGWRRFAARFGTAMVILFFGMMTVLGALMVWDEFEFGETSPGIGVPQWWYTIWLPIFSALITLRAMGLHVRQSRLPTTPQAATSTGAKAQAAFTNTPRSTQPPLATSALAKAGSVSLTPAASKRPGARDAALTEADDGSNEERRPS